MHRTSGSALKILLYGGGNLFRFRATQIKVKPLHQKTRRIDFLSQTSSGASILFPCIDFIPQGASIFVSTDYLQLRRFCFGNIPRCCAIFENFKQRQFHRFCLIVMIIPATLASTYLTHRFTYLECKDIYPLVI